MIIKKNKDNCIMLEDMNLSPDGVTEGSGIGSGYNFIPENLSGFASDLGSRGGNDGSDEPLPEFESEDVSGGGDAAANVSAAVSGSIVAMAIDRGAALGLAYLAHGEPDDFRADKSEYRDLQSAIESFMEQSLMRLSPGVQLFLALASIYGSKIPEALRMRKRWEDEMLAGRMRASVDASDVRPVAAGAESEAGDE